MNQEKFNLNKARKEAEKHEKKSVSLVSELKIDKKEESQDFLEEELEANYWRGLFEEELDKIKDDEDFKKAAINNLGAGIKRGKNGDGFDATWALRTISALKNLSFYEKEFKEKIKEIKDDDNFKKAAINNLEAYIKLGKNGDGFHANRALETISALKNLSLYKEEFKEKLDKIKDDEDLKKMVINRIETDIKKGKNGNIGNANWALLTISALKDLDIYKKEFKEKIKEIKDDEDFKKAAIKDLEDDIKKNKIGSGLNANWDLYNISALKNISEFWQDLAQEKRANMARDNKEGEDIPKRPEIR